MKTLSLHRSDIHTGTLILVNAQHPLTPGFTVRDCVPVSEQYEQVRLSSAAAILFTQLMQALSAQDQIVPVSGFRPHGEQCAIWDECMQSHGEAFTKKYVARPGCSEHESGLALDVALNEAPIDFLRPKFPYTGICQSFRQMAPRFGFVQRYPRGREQETGIGHEPWHFRYVGTPHARIMQRYDLTREGYIDFLRDFPYPRHPYKVCEREEILSIGFVPVQDDGTQLQLHAVPYQISGNNVDGVIVTTWEPM